MRREHQRIETSRSHDPATLSDALTYSSQMTSNGSDAETNLERMGREAHENLELVCTKLAHRTIGMIASKDYQGSDFQEVKRDLTQHLVSSACSFAVAKGFQTPTASGMRQMSVSMEDVSQDLLTFGMDVWPDSAFEPLPRPANDDARGATARRWGMHILVLIGIYTGLTFATALIPATDDQAEASVPCASAVSGVCVASPFPGRTWGRGYQANKP